MPVVNCGCATLLSVQCPCDNTCDSVAFICPCIKQKYQCSTSDVYRSVDLDTVDQLQSVSVEDRATQTVTDDLEIPPAKHFPASWTFTQVSKQDEETLGEVVSERVPSPQNTEEQDVFYELEQSSVHLEQCHAGMTMECQSEDEEEDLFLDVPEPSVLPKPTDACELSKVLVSDRQWMLAMIQRVFSESDDTQPQQFDHEVHSSTMEEVPKLFGLAAKALATPTLAILQDVATALHTVDEVAEKRPASEVIIY